MSKIIAEGSNAISNARKLIENQQGNLNSVSDPNATRIDGSVESSHSGSAVRRKVVYSTPVNELQAKIRRDNFTRASKSEVISDSLATYQTILGGAEDTEFQLLSAVNELIGDLGGLPNNNDIPTKIAMIDKAESLSMKLNNTVNGIRALRDTAHLDLINTLERSNETIQQLFEVNRQLNTIQTGSSAAFRLQSVRDKLLTLLATDFSIKVQLAGNGAALVTLNGADKELVSINNYSRFSTSGVFNQEVGNMSTPEDLSVSLSFLDKTGKTLSTSVVQGGEGNLKGFVGGRIEGYISLRDDILEKALDGVRSMSKTVAKTFNDIHNSGSTWPPATRLVGEELQYASDFGAMTGQLTVSSLTDQGKHLTGSGGRIHERVIDFDKLRTNSQDGQVNLWDAIDEFNRVMDFNLTRQRAAIGQIQFQDAAPPVVGVAESQNEYLLNNIMLASTSDIQNNTFSFDFEIEGNSFFESEVQIAGVQLNGAALPGFAQQNFTVEKDFSGRKGLEINTGNLAPVFNTIGVTVVVKGANGVVHTGTVRYQVDTNNPPTLNQRVEYDTTQPLVGDFQGKVANQTGVGRLKFVDENGLDIPHGATNQKGRLVFESNTEEHRAAFRGSNLMSVTGLNNFFSVKGDQVSVRSDIAADPTKISAGQVSKGTGTTVTTKVGGAAANITVDYANGGGGNFAIGDIITFAIPSVGILNLPFAVFSFIANGDVPANENEIELQINTNTTVTEIMNRLNNHSILGQKYTVTNPAPGQLVITAKDGGSWGNLVVFNNLVASANTADYNGAGIPQQVSNHTSVNGTDVDQATTVFNYTIGSGSVQIFEQMAALNEQVLSFEGDGLLPASYGTINSRMSDILSLLVSQEVSAENENELLVNLADSYDLNFRETFGVDRNEALLESADLISYLRVLSSFQAQIIKLVTEVQQTIAAA